MLNYSMYELKEIKSLKDLKRSQEEITKDLFSTYKATNKQSSKARVVSIRKS